MLHIRSKMKAIAVGKEARHRSIIVRRRGRKAAGAALLIVAVIGTATAQLNRDRPVPRRAAPQAAPTQALPQEYAVLLSRSIFAKSGRSAGPGFVRRGGGGPDDPDTAVTSSRSADSSPESRWAFRGVFREGPQLIAFLEDLSSRKTFRMKVGDSVARGRIAEITLDRICYQVGDKRSVVEIGQTLEGGLAATPPPTSRPADSATTGAAASPPPSAPSSAEERMRLRRQQEGGR